MGGTTITVQGTASSWHDAERATVFLTVAHDGPEREPILRATTTVTDEVSTALRGLHGDDGPVTRWSADRISVWSQRPWNEQGRQLPLVYHASAAITARFRDSEALATFVERFAAVEGVTISSIEWDLSEETRLAVTTDVRRRAVEDAIAKATEYARAARLTTVEALAIADAGMLGDGQPGGGGMPLERMSFKAAAADSGGVALAFTPDRIQVAAVVDARFVAR
jgi:uncharacterized protein YggE